MVVKLYKTSSENDRVVKELTEELSLTGTLRDSTSILNPTLTIEGDIDIASKNYAYIEEFGRYYFIDDIVSIRNNLWSVSMSVDVLMSYKDDILNLDCIIERQERKYNLYLNDSDILTYANPIIQTKLFAVDNGLDKNANSLVLAVVR